MPFSIKSLRFAGRPSVTIPFFAAAPPPPQCSCTRFSHPVGYCVPLHHRHIGDPTRRRNQAFDPSDLRGIKGVNSPLHSCLAEGGPPRLPLFARRKQPKALRYSCVVQEVGCQIHKSIWQDNGWQCYAEGTLTPMNSVNPGPPREFTEVCRQCEGQRHGKPTPRHRAFSETSF